MSLAPLVLVFLGAAGAVWIAGIHLSNTTDVLDHRLGFGEAIGGLVIFRWRRTCRRSRSPQAPRSPTTSASPSGTSSAASRFRLSFSSYSTASGSARLAR